MIPTFDEKDNDDSSTTFISSAIATTSASNKIQSALASGNACSHNHHHHDEDELDVSSNKMTLQKKKSVRIDERKNVAFKNDAWYKDECKSRWYTGDDFRYFRKRKMRRDQTAHRLEKFHDMIDQATAAFMLGTTCQDLSSNMNDTMASLQQTMQVSMI
jgi:hypothetical protein